LINPVSNFARNFIKKIIPIKTKIKAINGKYLELMSNHPCIITDTAWTNLRAAMMPIKKARKEKIEKINPFTNPL